MSDAGDKPSGAPGQFELPDLDFAAKPAPKAATANPAAAAPAPPPAAAAGYGGDFDFGDDMEVERNAIATPMLATESAAPRGIALAGGRIELGDNIIPDGKLSTRSHVKVPERTNWAGGILATLLVLVFWGGSGFALLRFVHRGAGWNVMPIAQKALDGGSAIWSGAGSLSFLALAITFTIMAMYARPRSLGYGVSALGAVTIGVTLMIITFSVGPDGAPDVPPDGAVLVPWLFAVLPFGVASRFVRNAWSRCFEGEAKNHLIGIVFAVLAAGAFFTSAELLFGAGIGRWLPRM